MILTGRQGKILNRNTLRFVSLEEPMRLRPRSGCPAALLGALVIVSMFAAAVAVTQHVSPEVAEAAPEPAADGETTDEGPKKESFLAWLLRSLGWRYTIAFLAISFSFV